MTRKQIADKLLLRLNRGPSLGFPHDRMSPSEAEAKVRAWLASWITEDVIALVPELRSPKSKPSSRPTARTAT